MRIKREDLNIRDPFILRVENKYYLFGTTDADKWDGSASGFDVFESDDLENFEGPFPAFRRPPDFWADTNFWAPEVHFYRGRYYMLAAFRKTGGTRRCQILVSDTPKGPYAVYAPPFTPDGQMCLDATLYVEDGKPYMVYCREWIEVGDGEMRLVPMSADLKTTAGESKLLFRASEAPWVVPAAKASDFITDGPFVVRAGDGALIMLWSSAGKDGYAMGQARSIGGIFGSWIHESEPLIKNDGGHGMIFQKADGTVCMTYHYPNMPAGSERFHYKEVRIKKGKLVLSD